MSDNKPKRQHKATYATDKRNGGYLVRVAGPNANMFAGREVPVEMKGGQEHMETLEKLVWSGQDDGKISGYVGPSALYTFRAKPREKVEIEF